MGEGDEENEHGRPMDERERRLVKNETLFRSVNERIEEAATSYAPADDEHVYEFMCECSNADCNLLIELTVPQYEAVRANPDHFVVALGHELPEIETVVMRTSRYQVVAKLGEAAEYAERHDPRAPD